MPAEISPSDLSRAKTIEPNSDYPDVLEIRLVWNKNGLARKRVIRISAEQFFGRGSYGAPMPADAIVQHIERLRKLGKPAE